MNCRTEDVCKRSGESGREVNDQKGVGPSKVGTVGLIRKPEVGASICANKRCFHASSHGHSASTVPTRG